MIRLVICISLFFFSLISAASTEFLSQFKSPKPMIAALMIEKDLSSEQKVQKAIVWGKQQIQIAEAQGMDGILFEFRGGKILEPKISDETFQKMKRIAKSLVNSAQKLVVGVEILWHYPEETLRLAKESGASFVRLDFYSDEVIADKKRVPIDPKKIQEYRKKIAATDVIVLTDIQVKYSEMVNPKITLEESAKKAIALGSDGVIVTSTKSGKAPEPSRPRDGKKGAGKKPVLIGSGFSYENAESLLKYADAVIVGTSISVKTGGPLVPEKVKRLMKEVRRVREKSGLYPQAWWAPVKAELKSWEIAPNAVSAPHVVLSKRTDLGVLSNFSATPFQLDGKTFASMEGFWQSLKYPANAKDPRHPFFKNKLTRNQVEKLSSFAAKKAGDEASKIMAQNGIDWVSHAGKKMIYRENKKGDFYHLIRRGMFAKFKQNEDVRTTLCATGDLILHPDHGQGKNPPPAWKYHEIWMELRQQNCENQSQVQVSQAN